MMVKTLLSAFLLYLNACYSNRHRLFVSLSLPLSANYVVRLIHCASEKSITAIRIPAGLQRDGSQQLSLFEAVAFPAAFSACSPKIFVAPVGYSWVRACGVSLV
jgi:hypothetical protein